MLDTHVVLIAPGLKTWELSESKERTYRKELIYVGDFVKDTLKFSVDEDLLHHWVSTFNEMKDNGIDVPVPVEHTQDPEKRRGTLLGLSVARNDKGVPALFGDIQFKDETAASLATTAQTSIYVPPEFQDGKGRKYKRPIQHVALTDYPVVPGLKEFQVIAASFQERENEVSLKTLIGKLGLKIPEGKEDDDAMLETLIVNEWKVLKSKTPKPEDKKPEDKKPAIAAGLISMAKENRRMKLDKLVQDGHITPAVCSKLGEQYCNNERVSLSLSSDSSDGFDEMIEALKENDPLVLAEKTGPQDIMSLSNYRNDKDNNPLLKDAEKRAAEAK